MFVYAVPTTMAISLRSISGNVTDVTLLLTLTLGVALALDVVEL